MTIATAIEPHNTKPAAVWSSGGTRYDQVSRGIADSIEHCVLRLDPQPGERVLDLATGTGWTSRLVAKRGATVVGADIADDLLAGARERAKAEGLSIEYRIGDAEKLPFADGEFDAVVSTCGVMFASRPEAAAAEIGRVTRKSGRIALTTWLPDREGYVVLPRAERRCGMEHVLDELRSDQVARGQPRREPPRGVAA